MMKHKYPRETRTAAQAYNEHEQAIQKALATLNSQLADLRKEHEADPKNWCVIGSLAEVRERLATTVSFLADDEE